MRVDAPHVRIVDVETCDFTLMPSYSTRDVLQACRPTRWERYFASPVARAQLAEIGVERRFLTHVPGTRPRSGRLTALDLAGSAISRLRERRREELAALDALIFVSTSNPNPVNCQAALLAHEFEIRASCMDLKAGCSAGLLGILHASLLIEGGCGRVLVVMAETLSQFADPEDLAMSLSVGDGAACVLLERCEETGFRVVVHGTAPEFAHAMEVQARFPPVAPETRYVYSHRDELAVREWLQHKWRSLFEEMLEAGHLQAADLSYAWCHQTDAGQLKRLARATGMPPERITPVVHEHGNMGTPTFAVAMARDFGSLHPGDHYLLQAIGGGVSWCAILAQHH